MVRWAQYSVTNQSDAASNTGFKRTLSGISRYMPGLPFAESESGLYMYLFSLFSEMAKGAAPLSILLRSLKVDS
jgi:hypothetical protein